MGLRSYVEIVKIAEGVPVCVPCPAEDGFKLTPERLRAAVTDRSRVIMLNSPSNPTGAVYSRGELEALADALRDYPRIIILSDEIYENITYVGKVASITEFPGMPERTVVINGVSKAYAMTGWRVGYMAAPDDIAKAVTKLQGQYTSGTSTIAQKAALAAYTGPQQCVEDMRRAFARRRDLIVSLAREIPGWKFRDPDGAFYLFADVSHYIGRRCGDRLIESSADYVLYLLEEGHVAGVDGKAFNCDGHIRLSYATSEENIREAMRRIADASARLV